MSPEQALGESVDHRTDVWASGVVLYEMVTGKLPFRAEYDQAVIYAILNEEPAPFGPLESSFQIQVFRIIQRALDKDPSQRFQTMDELLDHLQDIRDRGNSPYQMESEKIEKGVGDEQNIRSLVVLPLANYSNDPDQEYFVDGMTDALTAYLSKLPGLKVISRTSAMRYKKSKKSLPDIASELKVDSLLEGSVIRSENRIRVTVQLIRAVTDSHLWAENYERDFEDIILLQSEISQAIADGIKLKLNKVEKKRLKGERLVNPESYDAYLRGLFHFYKVSSDHFQTALDYFILALEKDPNSALAYVGIAYVWLARSYWGMAAPSEVMPQAKDSALKAIALDDTLDEAHKVKATILNNFDWDWNAAEQAYQKTLELNPNNADARLFYAAFLRSMKRGDEAMGQAKKGLESDPFNPFAQSAYVGQLLYQHRYDEAISRLKGIVGSELRLSLAHRFLWIAYLEKEMYREAIDQVKKFFFTLGKNEFAELVEKGRNRDDYIRNMVRLAEKLETRFKTNYIQPVWIARLNAHAGNNEQALRWLEQAYEDRDPIMVNLNCSLDWKNLRSEPRFKKLLEKMNLPE
jgi:TolB-like protein